jgi:hypothetical protein
VSATSALIAPIIEGVPGVRDISNSSQSTIHSHFKATLA